MITGIGHERDETIADLVAHTKQKTPTAVAEFILQGFMDFESQVDNYALAIAKSTSAITQQANLRLTSLAERLQMQASNKVSNQEQDLNSRVQHLAIKTSNHLERQGEKLRSIEAKHQDLDPGNVLKRGYTFTTSNRNSIFAEQVQKDDQLVTYSRDQIIESKVTKTSKNDKI